MNATIHFNKTTRRVALIDREGIVWRVFPAGVVTNRRARPFFQVRQIAPGLLEIGYATKARRVRLERADETPDGREWIALTPTQAAAKLVGWKPARGAALLKVAARAGRVLFDIGSAAVAVKRMLEPTNK